MERNVELNKNKKSEQVFPKVLRSKKQNGQRRLFGRERNVGTHLDVGLLSENVCIVRK
jgi:hypothetical protein